MYARSLFSLVSFALVLGFFAACGGKNESSTSALETLGGTKFINKGATGYLAESALAQVESASNFRIKANLEVGGKFTLISNCNESLQRGVEIAFTRMDATRVAVTKNGEAIGDLVCERNGDLTAMVEIHNDEVPAHVVVWNSHDIAAPASFDDEAVNVSGAGDKWGVQLDKASLSQIVVGAKEMSDE